MQHPLMTLDADGRILIPALVLRELDFQAGEELHARVEDGELRIYSRRQGIERAQAFGRRLKRPGLSEVDEFIAERRRES